MKPVDPIVRLVGSVALAAAAASCGGSAPPEVPQPSELEAFSDPRLAEAVRTAREAVAANPGLAVAWGRLGHVYLVHGWGPEAAECYRRAVEIEPRDFKWHYYLGRSVIDDDESSAEAFGRALALSPDYVPAMIFYGDALTSLGRSDEARAQFERVTKLAPTFPSAWQRLGELALGAGRLDEARGHLQRALSLNPDQSEAHSALAKVYMILRDESAARRHAEAARRPSNFPPIEDPLWVAVEMESRTPRGFLSRAMVFLQAGRVGLATEELEKLVSGEQSDPQAWAFYGKGMLQMGRHGEARKALDRALSLDPTSADANRVLEELRRVED